MSLALAFAMGAKKSGHNIDRNTQEKITDAGRSMYEKATGYVQRLLNSSLNMCTNVVCGI
jgi:hypothetical protein